MDTQKEVDDILSAPVGTSPMARQAGAAAPAGQVERDAAAVETLKKEYGKTQALLQAGPPAGEKDPAAWVRRHQDDLSALTRELNTAGIMDPSSVVPKPPAEAASAAAPGAIPGLTPEQARAVSTGAGAVGGMLAEPVLRAAIPTEASRTEQALRSLRQQEEIQRTLRNLVDQQAITRGAAPISVATPTTTALPAAPGAVSALDEIQHAAATTQPTSSLARERGQQFLTKSTFEAGRGQQKVLDELARRGLISPDALERFSLEKGATVPASGESRVLTTQAGAYQVEQGAQQAQQAEQRAARARQLLEELRARREAQERTAAALREASDRAAAQRSAAAAAEARLAQATPGPLSRLGAAVARPLTGALGGAGAGLSAYDAYQRFLKGDTSGAVISALGGLGGLMALFPGGQIPGMAIGAGTAGAQYINDLLKGNIEASGNLPATDALGNPLPQ